MEGHPLQSGGEDPTKDGVISRMDHHLVLILAEVLNQIERERVFCDASDFETAYSSYPS